MIQSNSSGSFLVRDSESTAGDYTLSIRDKNRVVHYPIQYQFLGSGVFLVTNQASFESIPDLVAHYRKSADGLCRNLTFPCVMPETPPTVGLSKLANQDWDIVRRQLKFIKRVGAGQFGTVCGTEEYQLL